MPDKTSTRKKPRRRLSRARLAQLRRSIAHARAVRARKLAAKREGAATVRAPRRASRGTVAGLAVELNRQAEELEARAAKLRQAARLLAE